MYPFSQLINNTFEQGEQYSLNKVFWTKNKIILEPNFSGYWSL